MMHSKPDLFYDVLIADVQRPSRYIDSELNLPSKGYAADRFNVLLVFPDTYEIGMSHLGIRVLYQCLALMDGVGVELAFAPWPDLEEILNGCGEQLRSLQTGTPAGKFDLIGISLTYELHYTNLLMILDLAGIPLEASHRSDGDPIVVVGGPCCTNPLPFMDAVDAVFLGDGEESLPEAVHLMRGLKASGAVRSRVVEELAGIEGVYVDGITPSAKVRHYRLLPGDLPHRPIVPSSGIVHDRLAVEIMRGCTRGCRFCHAGIVYRPRRERGVNEVFEAVCKGLDATGWDEVSLLSLSTSDYTYLVELLSKLSPELRSRNVSLAWPSLRPETITRRIVDVSSLMRKSGITLAPEAGTERLRCVINKWMSDQEILEGCLRLLQSGWQSLKLYFMIGLPTETREDLRGIADLVREVLMLRRPAGRFRLSVSISPFVPKPHTPFQWERQCSIEELRERERFLSGSIKSRRVRLSLRDPALSKLEGVFARGDRRLWPVLLSAYRSGCRFDGWRDRFRFDLWIKAFEENGLEFSDFTTSIPLDAALPWSSFIPLVRNEYLLREREKALSGELTPDCRTAGCRGCGACSGQREGAADLDGHTGRLGESAGGLSEKNVPSGRGILAATAADLASGTDLSGETASVSKHVRSELGQQQLFRYRCIYEKVGRERFLSHLEVMNLLQRALRRSELPLCFSMGFHPHPRISMGPSLAVGMEALREFFDIELKGPVQLDPGLFDDLLPGGIRVRECRGPFTRREGRLPEESILRYAMFFGPLRSILESCRGGDERLSNNRGIWYLSAEVLGEPEMRSELVERCLPEPSRWMEERLGAVFRDGAYFLDRKGRRRSCTGCSVERSSGGTGLDLFIPADSGGSLRPKDLLEAVLPRSLSALVKITRLEILYKYGDEYLDPIALLDRR